MMVLPRSATKRFSGGRVGVVGHQKACRSSRARAYYHTKPDEMTFRRPSAWPAVRRLLLRAWPPRSPGSGSPPPYPSRVRRGGENKLVYY